MPGKKCSQDGCGESHYGAGLCRQHYMRRYRTGTVEPAPRPAPPVSCAVEDCDRSPVARSFCSLHWTRWRKHGDPLIVALGGVRAGPDHPLRREDIEYFAAHSRVRASRGSAKSHACLHCGGTARHWAYDHEDQDERTGQLGMAYSLDPGHYIPLCARCHARFDHPEWSVA